MAKNLHRVLAIMLTVMMVLSMVSVFAFASETVTAFAETYQTKYKELYGKDAVISNSAVLVDSAITADEEAAETFTRTWDGIEFSFKYGTNAFKSLTDAYSSGATEIIVLTLDSTDTTKLIVKNNAKLYSPAWNEAPMVEMANDSWKAVDSNGADWTKNDTYFGKTITVKSIIFDNTVTSSASIYGFSLTKAFTLDASLTADFRAPDLENPVTMNIVNTYVAPNDGNYIDEVFYYTYGDTNGTSGTNASNKATFNNKDVLNVKNMWVDRTKFAYNGRGVFPAYTTFDGLYIDLSKRVLASNSPLLSSADDSTITIKRSNLRGQVPDGKHFYLSSAKAYNTTRVATLENNILWMNSTNVNPNANLSILTPNMEGMTKLEVKDNFINRQGASNNVLLPYYSNLAPAYDYTIHITGNKILGLAKSDYLLNSATLDGSTYIANNYIAPTKQTSITPTTENCATLIAAAYATEVGIDPATTGNGTTEFNAASINNFYYDYAMTMSSSAFPLVAGTASIGGEAATIDNDASTITFAVGTTSVAAADFVNYTAYNDKIKAEVTDQGFTTVKPTVTIKDMVAGTPADAVDTTKAGLYSLTVAFGSYATKQYTVTVGNFEAPYFTDETNGYVGTTNGPDKTAVLVDTSLANEAPDSEVIKVWDGNPYTFKVGANAFGTYAAAEAAVGDGGKIIVTNLGGGNLNITKTVNVYAPNWNKKPFVVGDAETDAKFDGGTWKATDSEAADWTANDAYTTAAVTVADICIDADLAGSVGVHGFTVTSNILLGGKTPRTSDANTTNVTISNTVVDSTDITANGLFNEAGTKAYNNTDTLTFKNVYIKSVAGTNSRIFGDNLALPAHMVFDGLWINLDNINATYSSNGNTVDQIKSAALDSSITFKNSNVRKTSSTSGFYWQFYQATPETGVVARKLAFENSIILNSRGSSYGGIGLIQNSYSDVKLDGNLIMDTTAYTALFQKAASVARFTSVNFTLTNNAILGYSEPSLGTYAASAVNAEIHDNFIVKANHKTVDEYKAVIGSTAKYADYTLKTGTPDRYWLDYAMTKSNVALTLEGDTVFEVANDVVKVAKDAVVTKQSIISNAVADAPADSTPPTLTVTDIDGAAVTTDTIGTSESTLYTVTLEFAGIASKVYTINVDNFEAPYFTNETDGYVDATGTISKNAVLLDTSFAGESTGNEVIKVWDGNPYTFIVGTNAFGTYTEAETAATADGAAKQIIVTGWNGSAITVTKAVNIYGPNRNTEPFVRPEAGYVNGKWSATASNGAAWVENTTTWDDSVKLAGVTINAEISDTVGLYGFEYTGQIDVDGAGRTSYTEKAVRNIVNSKFNTADKIPVNVNYGAAAAASNVDELNIVNFYSKQQYPTGFFTSEYPAPNTTMDGWMFDVSILQLKDAAKTANIWFKTYAKDSTVTIKNSYIYGTNASYKIAMSHANQANKTSGERVFTYDNNVLTHTQSTGIFAFEAHDTSALNITNNYIDKSKDTATSNQSLVNSAVKVGSRLATEGTVTFSGNKIVGYQTGFPAAITNDFTPENNFVTTAAAADASTAIGIALTSPVGKTGAYWLDYAMTKSSAALTLESDSVFTVVSDVAKVAKDAVVTKQSIISNAMADAPADSTPPTLTVTDIDGAAVTTDTIGTSESTLYTVTLEFADIASKVYTINVDNFEAPYFTDETDGYVDATGTISKNAVLLDSSLATVAADTEVMKTWDGKRYTFKVGTNAFGTYTEAENAATAEGAAKQIIVTGWDGSAITVTKAVNIYTPNRNTEPFVRDTQDGEWKAVKSNGAAWTENTAFDDSFKVGGVVVDSAVSGTVGLYGFYYTNTIDVDGETAGRGGNTNKLTVNIVNSKYESTTKSPFNANYKDITSGDETYIKNFFIKKTTGRLFSSEFPAPFTTFEGLYYNLADLTSNAWHKTSTATSKFVIKDSYLFGTSSCYFKVSVKNTDYAAGDTREVVFDNNVMKHAAYGGMLVFEPHDTTTLTITNNYMDKSVDNSALLISSGGIALGTEVAADVTKTITFTGNKIIGFTRTLTDAFDAKLNDAQNTVVTIQDNYVTTATSDFENAVGVKLTDDAGNGGNYWVDYDMTQRPCAHPTLNDVEGKDKTCTEDGYTAYKECADCGEIIGKETIPAGHDLVDVEAKDKTCTENGYTAHKACQDCDYKDDAYEVISASHNLVDVPGQEGVCEQGGYTAHKACQDCDYKENYEVIPAGHKLEDIEAKAKTCTEPGYTAHKACKNCDYTEGKTEIPASHDYGDYVVTEATCQSGEKQTRTCESCGETDESIVGSALDYHKYTNYVHYKDATCTSPAQERAVCDWCGEAPSIRDVEGSGVAPSGHSFGEYVQISPATCVSVAQEKAVCGLCGESDIRDVEDSQIDPDAHSYGDWQDDATATCHSNATQKRECQNGDCGHIDYQELDGTMVEHTFENYQVTTAATCISKAYETAECIYHDGENCIATDTRIKADSEIDTINGHSYKNPYSNGDATCVTDGTLSKDCRLCGETFDAGVDVGSKDRVAHTWGDWTYPNATCGSWGMAHRECEVDGCTAYEDANVANNQPIRIPHAFGEYVYNNDATCYKDGTKTAECSVCGATDTEKDTAHLKGSVAHNWSEWKVVVAATCTANATITRECLVDRCYVTETTEQTGSMIPHSYGKYEYNNDATHESDGTKTAKCSVCGHLDTKVAIGTKVPAGVVIIVDTTKVFTDIKANDWYKQYVDYAYSHGIFKGYTTTTFSPDTNLTRAQIVQVFANLAGVDTTDKAVATIFTDVKSGEWYAPAIKWANEVGIVSGMGDGTFAPNAEVTREQMCLMLVNYIEKCQGKTLKNAVSASVFADDASISGWAKEAVYKCASAGLVSGVGNNTFAPLSFAARSHAATLFTNFHKEYVAK